ncbi:MAG: tungstate transport system permease protein [Bacteroidetes bacterium]|nr:MAG: tungstate transport system permease protein [Bacteroidota bacterium]
MQDIYDSMKEAWNLIITWNAELYGIILLTLAVTVLSTIFSSVTGIAAGVFIGSTEFKGRRFVIRLIQTFMGLPPVVAGLAVFLFLSRKGPFGQLSLLFTPAAMVIAQVVIIFPIIMGLTSAAVRDRSTAVLETCRGLCLPRFKALKLLLFECRYAIISAVLAGYGRAISEVGAVMLVGGNIQYHTRVMTTAIVLETGKGNYDKALALGLLLLLLSFFVNWIVQRFQENGIR